MTEARLLEVRGLRVGFPGREQAWAVDGAELSVGVGETVALVGESGCGKTASALAIMGLLPPGTRVAGSVLFQGRDLLTCSPRDWQTLRGRQMGMVFQDPMSALNPVLRVGTQVVEAVRLHQALSRAQARARAEELLGWVGLPDPARQLRAFPHQLSGGMRQRVMLAMALCCGPALLLADEPTTALDVTIQAQVLALLARIQAEQGTAILLVTHDLQVARQLARRVVVMYAGRTVEVLPARDLPAGAHHPYTRALLAAQPGLGNRKGLLADIEGEVPAPSMRPPGCAFAPRCPVQMPVCHQQVPPRYDMEAGAWAACHRLAEVQP